MVLVNVVNAMIAPLTGVKVMKRNKRYPKFLKKRYQEKILLKVEVALLMVLVELTYQIFRKPDTGVKLK